MATRFPSTGAENQAPADPPRKTRAKRSGDEGLLRRMPLAPAAVVLIAAGAALLLIFSGSIAGVETGTIGIVALVLGAAGLMAQAAARRSRASSAR